MSAADRGTKTFPMRVAARLTGVAAERIRAWETRYGAIRPARTGGGSRLYSEADLDRLRLLRRVVEAGHRIGDVARLDLAALQARLPGASSSASGGFELEMEAVRALDASALTELCEVQLKAEGALPFARDFVLPLASKIGQAWTDGQLSVSAEHLATGVMRAQLLRCLEELDPDGLGPRVVFAAPANELHDLGLLVAALGAGAVGADVVFVGANVPDDDLCPTVRATGADVLALGFVTSPAARIEQLLRELRGALPDRVGLWAGGAGIRGCGPLHGVDRMERPEQLEAGVLSLRGSAVRPIREGAR